MSTVRWAGVNIERTAFTGKRSIVHDGHLGRRHTFADLVAVYRYPFLHEVRLEPVTDRLVYHRAAGFPADNHRHHARRRGPRIEHQQSFLGSKPRSSRRVFHIEQFEPD